MVHVYAWEQNRVIYQTVDANRDFVVIVVVKKVKSHGMANVLCLCLSEDPKFFLLIQIFNSITGSSMMVFFFK